MAEVDLIGMRGSVCRSLSLQRFNLPWGRVQFSSLYCEFHVLPFASRAVTVSAVARDSPETMGEAADTPRCPMLQREWLGEGQRSSLTRHKSGEGVEPEPPLALPLQRGGCRGRQRAASPAFNAGRSLFSPSPQSWDGRRKKEEEKCRAREARSVSVERKNIHIVAPERHLSTQGGKWTWLC